LGFQTNPIAVVRNQKGEPFAAEIVALKNNRKELKYTSRSSPAGIKAQKGKLSFLVKAVTLRSPVTSQLRDNGPHGHRECDESMSVISKQNRQPSDITSASDRFTLEKM
jgi:hypothetical protein